MTWRQLVASGPWLLSPHLQPWQKQAVAELRRRVPQVPRTLWILSSGTQSVGRVKALALTEENFLVSAAAVNEHLRSTRKDRWMRAIPRYHVGGASIYARATLSGARVTEFPGKWEARRFVRALDKNKISLTALVPTQLHDLAAAGLLAPAGLRAVVIGGGSLNADLYERATGLGWPVLPSYGLTECCSQVATAQAGSPRLLLLPHVEAALREGRVCLRSKAICRWVATMDRDGQFTLEDPTRDGWLATQDCADLRGRELKILGRADDVVKILGTLVPLQAVEDDVRRFFSGAACVLALESERAGHELMLLTENTSYRDLHHQLDAFNAQAIGPHRLKGLVCLSELPRNEMGKINKNVLRQLLLPRGARESNPES